MSLESALKRFINAANAIVAKRPRIPRRKSSPTYRALQKIIRRESPAVQRAFIEAIAKTERGTKIGTLARLIEQGDLDAAVNEIPWDSLGEPVLRDKLVTALQSVYEKTGTAASAVHGYESFSIVDPRAAEYLANYGATLVVEISDGVRTSLRTSLGLMVDEGIPATSAASMLRSQIGLHDKWTAAVDSYRARLLEAGEFSFDDITREVSRYSNGLRSARALNIARTEPAIASAAAQREAWQQMGADGVIDLAVAKRRWMESSNPCPAICDGMEGQVVGLNEPFEGGDGSKIDDAPAHPACACMSELLPDGE